MQKTVWKITWGFLLVLVTIAGSSGIAYAKALYLDWFNAKYGTEGTRLDSCITCHLSSWPEPSGPLNPYGVDFSKAGHSPEAFEAIEGLDSDGDGFSNKIEIENRTFPGDPGGDNGCFITTAAFRFALPQRIAVGPELIFRVCGTTPGEVAILIWLASMIAVTVTLGRKRLPKRHDDTRTL